MKQLLATLCVALSVTSVSAQTDATAEKYAATITSEDLNDYLSILASDALEGRETGKRGQKMAAALISSHFAELGLQGPVEGTGKSNYYQPVKLYKSTPGDTYLKVKDNEYKNFNKVIFYGSGDSNGEQEAKVYFAGNGTKEHYEGLNIKDKSAFVILENITKASEAISQAQEKGVKTLFILSTATDEDFEKLTGQFKGWLSDGTLSLKEPAENSDEQGIYFIAPSVAEEMFKTTIDKMEASIEKGKINKVKPATVNYKNEQISETVMSENVLGYLEGTDLKDELVVVTAHYDHIGRHDGEINNGADDDGSGTSAVMEMAEAFVKAKEDGHGPRRSILFMTVTGEEKGLLGSEYYADHPVFPLENTIVDLNIDMIGRIDPKHKDTPDYVYLVGSDRLSSELHTISEEMNSTYGNLELDYTYNDESHPDRIYYRSDHWNFAKNDVPVIFYFNGVHEDYHKPTDTIDKIDFDILTKRTKLVFHTAWELANRDKRPVVDKAEDAGK